MGSLGFLTEIALDELYSNLTQVFKNEFLEDPRIMLECVVARGKKRIKKPTVLNDITVNKGHFARLINLEVSVSGQFVTSLRSDGLIVASSTGSTGYTLSAGGPIVHPSLDNLIMTPICPHASALRPLVLSGDESIRIRVDCEHPSEKALLTADGQSDVTIDDRSVIEVTRSVNRLKLVKSSKRSYFATLREKFKLPL
jgi:NAD+ kinase